MMTHLTRKPGRFQPFMRLAILLLSALMVIFLCSSRETCAAAEPGWSPGHTWVFVVGVLKWKDKNTYSSFTPKDRRDAELVSFFRKSGVPEGHMVYLQDGAATKSAIETSLTSFLKKPAPGDLLFLYYCGHGSKTEKGSLLLASYDAGESDNSCWSARSIIESIERNYKGSRAFVAADCCQSGGLAEEVDQYPKKKVSYAVMASSSSREFSTGNWTFTQALLDGFRGNPLEDLNHDGKITLEEMAQFSRDEMQYFEEQLATSLFTGTFNPQTIVSRALGTIKPPAGNRVEAKYQGEWYPARIVEASNGRVKIHWIDIGYDTASSDEWRSSKDVREIKLARYPVGAPVEIEYSGEWYPARVMKVKGGIHFVHYDGYNSSWDEWVPSKRIRLPKK
jgi:hypothetical protein